MQRKNIILIGFMATGKTTVGKLISNKLNMNFIDTDFLIEKKNNMKIEEIFNKFGEKYFREEELGVVRNIYQIKNAVIATGGGIVLNQLNINLLRQQGLIFFLNGSIKTIMSNLSKSHVIRPLLGQTNWESKVRKILIERKELYLKSADFIINIDNKSVEEISIEIIEIASKYM